MTSSTLIELDEERKSKDAGLKSLLIRKEGSSHGLKLEQAKRLACVWDRSEALMWEREPGWTQQASNFISRSRFPQHRLLVESLIEHLTRNGVRVAIRSASLHAWQSISRVFMHPYKVPSSLKIRYDTSTYNN